MIVLKAVRFVAVFSTGLIAGILMGDRLGVTFARKALTPSSFISFQQALHEHFIPLMPALMGIAMFSALTWMVFIRPRLRTTEGVLLALATVAVVSVFTMTRMINVPINVQLMTWSAATPPAELMETWARWEQAHTVRTCIAVVGFALQILGLAAAKSAPAA